MIPIIDDRPSHGIKLPFSKQKVEMKPYRSAQEKILLQAALDKSDRKNWLVNLKNILNENMKSDDFVIDSSMTMIDFLYLSMKMRTISKGETFDYSFRCDGEVKSEDGMKQCNFVFKEKDSIDSMVFIKNIQNSSILVEVNKKLSLELAPLKLEYLEHLSELSENDYNEEQKTLNEMELENSTDQEKKNRLIAERLDVFIRQISFSISKIIHTDSNGNKKVYTEFTKEELIEKVINNLTFEELEKLFEEKNKLISITLRIKKICPKCENVFEREETDFFMFLT